MESIKAMKRLLILFLFLSSLAYGQITVPKTYTATGTDTYAITESKPDTYTTNENFYVRFTNANLTTTVKLNRATLGDKSILQAGGTAMAIGDIKAGGTYLLNYNGTYYQIVGGGGGGSGITALTGGVTASGAGSVVATVVTNANLTGVVTSTGNATAIANGAITNAMLTNGAVANLSGTNTGDQTNISGNAATVTTNANLTGVITSVGNATSIASQTGTGTTFAMSASPTFTGSPIAPTQIAGDNSTKIATTAYVDALSLTVGTGLTNTAGTLTSNISTGVSGGQTAIGGTASGNSLTLSSTSNATKGTIIIGNSSYNEANNTQSLSFLSAGSVLNGTWTGTASGQSNVSESGTITGRTNASGGGSDIYTWRSINPTFVVGASAATQTFKALEITGTFPASSLQEALSINPTLSGAASNSYLLRVQLAGAARFAVLHNGNITATGTSHSITGATTFFTTSVGVSTGSSTTDFLLTNQSGGGLSYRLRSANAGVFTLNDGTTDLLTINSTNRHLLPAGSTTIAQTRRTSGTIMTTAGAGVEEYNGSFFATKASTLRFAIGGCIADFTADANNSGTGETDIFTYTTPVSTLANTGEKINFEYTLTLNDVTATAQIKVLFAGTTIGDTGALTVSATGAVVVRGWIIRTGASTARSSVNISSPGASTAIYTSQIDLTGLTFTNTNIVKVTGTAGGAGGGSNDITGKLGTINWMGQANN